MPKSALSAGLCRSPCIALAQAQRLNAALALQLACGAQPAIWLETAFLTLPNGAKKPSRCLQANDFVKTSLRKGLYAG